MTVKEYATDTIESAPADSDCGRALALLLKKEGESPADTEGERYQIFEKFQEDIEENFYDQFAAEAAEHVATFADYGEMGEDDIQEAEDNDVHERVLELALETLDFIGICPEL